MNDPKHLTLMDRSRCLEGQTERLLPTTSILTCYRHLRQELLTSPAGRASLEVYDKSPPENARGVRNAIEKFAREARRA